MKVLTSTRCIRLLLTLLFCFVLPISMFAQSTTDGAVGGTVVDPQDKVIRGAAVTVKNNGSNQVFSTKTDQSGYFRIGQLPPAAYTVTVNAEGFAPYKAEQVIVTVGSLTAVAPHLTIGTTEQVEVTAETPLVNVTSAEFTQTLNSIAIENLPINGGRWSNFTVLTPGVVSNSDGFGLLSFRGTSALLNNVTVDGADNNQAFFSEERGRTRAGYSTAKTAVQEFQVNTSNYSAEYGRSAGGVVNTVTKSGTNQIHGEAYWYDRNNEWGATNPYSFLTSVTPNGSSYTTTSKKYKPKDVRMMGGFGVGGAIIKDKLFWFLAYDKFHRNFPGFSVPNSASSFFAVPDAALPAGKNCGSTGVSSIDYNVCTLAAEMLPNGATGNTYGRSPSTATIAGVTAQQYTAAAQKWNTALFGGNNQLGLLSMNVPVPRKGDQNIIFPKVDWIINSRNHAFFEANRMRWASPGGVQSQGTNPYGPSSFGNDYVKDTWGVAKLDTMISNRISNQFRFQYGRDFEYETDQTPNAYELQTLVNPVNALTGVPTGYTNPTGLPPNVYIGSYQWGTLYYTNRIAYPDEYKTQFADTVNYTLGRHNLKFGVDFAHSKDSLNNLYMQYGEYSFAGLPQYVAQLYDPAHAYFTDYYQGMQGGAFDNVPTTYQFSTNDIAFFAQDDWKVSRRLTVNLGLRYDTETMPGSFKNLEQQIQLGTKTLTTGVMPDRPQGLGPRAGFAWDAYGDGKTVLRGGYGIYYGRVINAQLFGALTSTGSDSSQINYDYYANGNGKSLANAFPQIYKAGSQLGGTKTVAVMDKGFTIPSVQEIDLSLQQDLGKNTVLSISYLGSLGHHLANFKDLNIAPSTGTATYTVSNTQSGNTVAGMPIAAGTTYTVPLFTSRLTSGYGAVIDDYSGANSNYSAVAIQLEKRMSNHVQFSVNYTWSHALDTGVNGTTSFSGTTNANVLNPYNPGYGMYGNSSNNVPQRLTVHAVIESPWKHHNAWQYLLDGWQAAPVFQAQTGLNYSVSTTGSGGLQSGIFGAGGATFLPGTRGGFRQPNTFILDLRLAKQFSIGERVKAEFSADSFNLPNHNNITGVNTTAPYSIVKATSTTGAMLIPNSNAVSNGNALFGTPTNGNSNYVYNPRQIQLGARITF